MGQLTFSDHIRNLLSRCGEVTDIGLNSLTQGLQALPSLTTFKLAFSYSLIGDAGLDDLRQVLQNLTNIQKIFLKFRG